jgi:hypothetical protein
VFGSVRKQADDDQLQNELGNGFRVLERAGVEWRRPAKDLDGKDSLLFFRQAFERLQYLGRLFAPAKFDISGFVTNRTRGPIRN